MSIEIIKPEVIPFTIYIFNKKWEYKEIKFPYQHKDNNIINIYNIDKLSDVMNKIYLLTGIGIELWHIRGLNVSIDDWLKAMKPNISVKGGNTDIGFDDEDEIAETIESKYRKFTFKPPVDQPIFLGYIHHTGDNIFPQIEFRGRNVITDSPLNAFNSPYNISVKSLVADTQFAQFNNLSYNADDKFIIDFAPNYEMILIPFTTFILPNSIDAPYIANDISTLSKIYEGFIIKYYPMMSEMILKLYLQNNLETYHSSELMAKIKNIIEIENNIMYYLISAKYKDITFNNVDMHVIAADILTKPEIDNNILLRNVFDKIHVKNTKDVNIIYMRYEFNISPQLVGLMLNKDVRILIVKYMQNGLIPKITNENKKYANATDSLIIAITGVSRNSKNIPMLIFLRSNGSWIIKTLWDENITIDNIIAKAQKLTDYVIDEINTNIIYYGKNNVPKLSKKLSIIENISVILVFNYTITVPEFKIMRNILSQYIEANMATYISAVNFEIQWIRGILKPCFIKIIHYVNNIKFEIYNTNMRDLSNLYSMLYIYMQQSIEQIKEYKKKNKLKQNEGKHEVDIDISNMKHIKKLRDTDPKLFDNLKPGMIYSKKCQGIKQPETFLESETKKMSVNERKELIKYWNFTYGNPIYYRCQKNNNKRLEFSFLTGIHINDYCVPCCKIKEAKENSKKEAMENKCLKDRKFTDKYKNINPSLYIFIANKELPYGRIGYLPKDISDIFVKPNLQKYEGFYTLGVQEIIPALQNTSANIVFAICNALEITVNEFILDIIKNIKSKENKTEIVTFKHSLKHPQKKITGGYSQEYIYNLVDALTAIFINRVDFYNYSMKKWDEFFIYQTLEIYNINVILFKVNIDEILIMDNNANKIFIIEYVFEQRLYSTLQSEIAYYPIYFINVKNFIKEGTILQKIFTNEIDGINKQIVIEKLITLPQIIKKNYKISELYINRNNKVYAIIIDGIYLPITYSHIYPKIKTNYNVFTPDTYFKSINIGEYLTKFIKLVSELNYTINALIQYNDNIIAIEINRMYSYILPTPINAFKIFSDITIKKTNINLIDVNLAIAENRSPNEEYFDLMFKTYYHNNLYDIIKIEIINQVDNGKLKQKEFYKLTVDDLVNIIPHEIVSENELQLTDNIVMPCSAEIVSKSNIKMSHCNSEYKLMVPPNFKEYLEIVLIEMKDKYRNFILANKRNLVINMLDFEQISGEIIDWKIV